MGAWVVVCRDIARITETGGGVVEEFWPTWQRWARINIMHPIRMVAVACRAAVIFAPPEVGYLRRIDGSCQQKVSERKQSGVLGLGPHPQTGLAISSVIEALQERATFGSAAP